MVDAMEPFVQAIFSLEGLALLAYEEIHKLYCAISSAHYPNTIAISVRWECTDPGTVML